MYSQLIQPINGLLNQLASHITQDELSQMKFLLEDTIPKAEEMSAGARCVLGVEEEVLDQRTQLGSTRRLVQPYELVQVD